MIIIGLTGGIAMGKSTVARMFRRLGVPVINADAIVHELLAAGGGAFASVAKTFPEALEKNKIDRKILGMLTFSDKSRLHALQEILHPLVREKRKQILATHARARTPLVVLEIPLLFESGAERLCDYVVVASAGERLQKQRAMQRPGMTEEKFTAIKSHQMPDKEKKNRAAFVISTGKGKAETMREVHQLLETIHMLKVKQKRWKPGYGQ